MSDDIMFMADQEDQSYRTCSICGGDCIPELSGADGLGVRHIFSCSEHGLQSVVDPFHYRRG